MLDGTRQDPDVHSQPCTRLEQGPKRPIRPTTAALWAAVVLVVALIAYWGVARLGADASGRGVANARAIARVEVGAGVDVGEIQRSPLAQGWTGRLLTWWYALGYWPVVIGSVVAVAVLDRRLLGRVLSAFAMSGAFGVIVISAFPVAPPRLVGGAVDHVARSEFLSALAHPSGLVNPHAAMPSFHVAWTVLAALAVRRSAQRIGGRVLGEMVWASPAVMSLAVVTTGNHWVLDVVAGLALAVVAWWIAPHNARLIRRHIGGGWGRQDHGGCSGVGGSRLVDPGQRRHRLRSTSPPAARGARTSDSSDMPSP